MYVLNDLCIKTYSPRDFPHRVGEKVRGYVVMELASISSSVGPDTHVPSTTTYMYMYTYVRTCTYTQKYSNMRIGEGGIHSLSFINNRASSSKINGQISSIKITYQTDTYMYVYVYHAYAYMHV